MKGATIHDVEEQIEAFPAMDGLRAKKGAGTKNESLNGLDFNVFNARRFRENAHRVITRLENYLNDTTTRGLSLSDPEVLLEAARNLTTGESAGMAEQERLESILDLYIKTAVQVYSPGYMGRQFSGVVPVAGIVEMISAIVSQPSSFYETGQLPNVVERLMAEEFNQFIGWAPDSFTMVTTSGGSLANMTAILAARNDRFPRFWSEGSHALPGQVRPAIAVSEDAHYSVYRAAGILGIGEDQIIRLPLNKKRQIDIGRVSPLLDEAESRGGKVFCIVASAGSTAVGAFDPIDELAWITQQKDIWLHVDGAHGASLLLSDQLRHRLKGIDKVDSFAWDAHKMMFVPALCTMLFYKNKEKSFGAFQQEASYIFESQPDIYTEYDSGKKNFECTKRPLIMNLWVVWALYGKELFSEKVEYLCRLAESAWRILKDQPDFETLHRPESNILCFRYAPSSMSERALPNFQVAIRNRIKKGGRFFISKVDIDGDGALRAVFMNHRIKSDHFRVLLDEIRAAGKDILKQDYSDVRQRDSGVI